LIFDKIKTVQSSPYHFSSQSEEKLLGGEQSFCGMDEGADVPIKGKINPQCKKMKYTCLFVLLQITLIFLLKSQMI